MWADKKSGLDQSDLGTICIIDFMTSYDNCPSRNAFSPQKLLGWAHQWDSDSAVYTLSHCPKNIFCFLWIWNRLFSVGIYRDFLAEVHDCLAFN